MRLTPLRCIALVAAGFMFAVAWHTRSPLIPDKPVKVYPTAYDWSRP